MEASGESGHVKSILRAAELLDVLSSAEGPLSLGELSERLGWAKSTTHGIISTLTAASLTEQRQSDGRYGLSLRAFELGCAARHAILLETAAVTGNFQILSPTGTRTPIHCSSHGKVLLAFRPENEREMLIRRLNLVKYTPATVQDADALRLACREICSRGYCVENGEYRMGLCSVSAPVLDRAGTAKYAVGIVGIARDGDLSAVLRGTSPVLAAADALSRKLKQMK